MEGVFEDESGETATLEVSETATAADLLREACAAFGRNELDSTLEVDGAVLCAGVVGGVSGGEESIGSLGVHSDSRFVLGRTRDRVLAMVAAWRRGFKSRWWDDAGSLPKWVWDDEVVALAAVAAHFNSFKYVSKRLRRSDAFMRDAATRNGRVLEHASVALRGDRELVLAAVASRSGAVKYASDELKADKEFVLASAELKADIINFACESLRADKDVMLAAVAQAGKALRCASADLKADEQVVLAALAKDGMALLYASEELKDDKQVVLAAVAKCGAAIQFASPRLQADKDVCAAAYGPRAPRRVSGSSKALLAAQYTKLTRS